MPSQNTLTTQGDADSAPPLAPLPPPVKGVEPPDTPLSDKQATALMMIMQGEPIARIVKEVDVNRSTLWRWRTFDPNFMAALNRWRGNLQAEVRDRVLSLVDSAATSLQSAISDGDGRLGLSLLEKIGVLNPGPDGPVDPYKVFGAGIDDTTVRSECSARFAQIRQEMTCEQLLRAPQLLALGIVVENQRAGRNSSRLLLELAGFPDGLTLTVEEKPCAGDSFQVCGPGLQDASAATEFSATVRQPHIQVTARVKGYSNSGFISIQSRSG